MKLYQPDDTAVPNTSEDNAQLDVTARETWDYVGYPYDSLDYEVKEIHALALEGGSGAYDPNPDNDNDEEAIIISHHAADRTLRFVPAPQAVSAQSGNKYRVEFEMPEESTDPPITWEGEVEIYDTSTPPVKQQSLPLTVQVTKGAPGYITD